MSLVNAIADANEKSVEISKETTDAADADKETESAEDESDEEEEDAEEEIEEEELLELLEEELLEEELEKEEEGCCIGENCVCEGDLVPLVQQNLSLPFVNSSLLDGISELIGDNDVA